jgi:hypothetical protein
VDKLNMNGNRSKHCYDSLVVIIKSTRFEIGTKIRSVSSTHMPSLL